MYNVGDRVRYIANDLAAWATHMVGREGTITEIGSPSVGHYHHVIYHIRWDDFRPEKICGPYAAVQLELLDIQIQVN